MTDHRAVAKIHKSRFSGDFISGCSLRTVERFYKWVDSVPGNYLITEVDGKRIIAFALFSTESRSLFSNFLRSEFLFILTDVPSMFRLVKTILKKIFSGDKIELTHNTELVYIAVDPDHESKGMGKKLLKAGEDKLKSIGLKEYFLQVYIDNEKAVGLYNKYGFTQEKEFKSGKRTRLLLKKVPGDE